MKTNLARERIVNEVLHEGIHYQGLVQGALNFSLHCKHVAEGVKCTEEVVHQFPITWPTAPIVKWFANAGWAFNRKEALCPKCKGIKVMKPSILPVKTILAVQRVLELVYNEKDGRYIGSNCDKMVANETGFAEPVVKHIREEIYGPLRENPVLLQLRGEIATLQEMLKDLSNRVDKELKP